MYFNFLFMSGVFGNEMADLVFVRVDVIVSRKYFALTYSFVYK